jgi:hypothetical protein
MIKAIEISLMITAVHVSMWQGMIFGWFRIGVSNWIDKLFGECGDWIKKPLFGCLICMSGIYTFIIYPILFGFDIEIIKTILLVIGINTLIAGLISRLYE